MTTTVSFTPAQAAAQITRDDISWGVLGAAAGPVSYGFRDTRPAGGYGSEATSFQRVNAAEKSAVVAALGQWASVANISFQAVIPQGLTNSATLLFANYTQPPPVSSAAHAYMPTTKDMSFASPEGDVWFNLASDPYTELRPGSYNYLTVLHEIGHALGLDHPGNYNAGATRQAVYEVDAVYLQDSLQYTVMSYFSSAKTGAMHTFDGVTVQARTPLRDDIAALQRLYGANMATRAGDTIYGFNSNADDPAFHLAADRQAIFSIWDAGGTNTLDLSGYSTNQILDLRQGAFSSAGALTQNISIAMNTVIQVGKGGNGNDSITGNDVDNILWGNAGNDFINGGGGINSAAYSGLARHYSVTISAGAAPFLVQDKVGTEGIDTLVNIQKLQFTDQILDVTWFIGVTSLAASQIGDLTSLYIASFNRAPDALGLGYWGSRLKDGMGLEAIARSFFVQPEAASAYPAGQSVREFVTGAYNNVLGRSPDRPGLDYWGNELQSGLVGKDAFLLAIINGARASTGGVADAQYLRNKELVGAHFALAQGLGNAAWAKAVMERVDGTAASVSAANALTDGFAEAAATASESEFVVKVLGILI